MNEADKALLRRHRETGDTGAREQLIERNMPLVRSLARRFAYRGEPYDDLVQIGAIGLIKAIDRFDLERQVELTTYATPTIVGEIKRHFRDRVGAVHVPRGLQELSARVAALAEHLSRQLGHSPTIAELASAAGVSEEAVVEAIESGRAYTAISLTATGVDEEGQAIDPFEGLGALDEGFEVSEDRAVLAPGLRALDEREQLILRLRFFEGLTQAEIAHRIGVSQMHVSRLLRRSLDKVRAEVTADPKTRSRAR